MLRRERDPLTNRQTPVDIYNLTYTFNRVMPYYQTQRTPCINFQSSPEIEGYREYDRDRETERERERAGSCSHSSLLKAYEQFRTGLRRQVCTGDIFFVDSKPVIEFNPFKLAPRCCVT
jgi:hypothetical protein